MHSTLLLALLSGNLAPIFALPTPPVPTVSAPIVDTINLSQPSNPLDEAKFTEEVKAIGFSVTGGPVNVKRQDSENPKLITHIGTPLKSEEPVLTTSSTTKKAGHTPHFKPDGMNLPRHEKRIGGVSLIEDPAVVLHLAETAYTTFDKAAQKNGLAPSSRTRRGESHGDESGPSHRNNLPTGLNVLGHNEDPSNVLGNNEGAGGILGHNTGLPGLLSKRSTGSGSGTQLPNTNEIEAKAGSIAESQLDAVGLPEDKIHDVGMAEGDGIREALVPGHAGNIYSGSAAAEDDMVAAAEKLNVVHAPIKRDGVFGGTNGLGGVVGLTPEAEKLAETVALGSLPGTNIHARV